MDNREPPETRLLVQPGSGTTALLEGIEQARSTVQIVIFRFDRGEVEMALKRAARRGVFVHALVAHTSAGQGGEITLRKLEMRLLADGITVTRTATDLVRYHDKLLIVDSETLYVLGFNFTFLDIDRSRSFGIVTRRAEWVAESVRLFTADATHQQYSPECDTFIVSPGNARKQLTELIGSAQRSLHIYDDKLNDADIMRLLVEKVAQGVDVRVIGSVARRAAGVQTGRLFMRLHAQVIIADEARMFLGSQSLRALELDARREAGVILDDTEIIGQVAATFHADWEKIHAGKGMVHADAETTAPAVEEAAVAQALPPGVTAELVKAAVKEAIKDAIMERIDPGGPVPIKDAVKQAAREALHELAS